MSLYGQAWLVWVLMFVAIEGAALRWDRSEALSFHVWRFLGLRGYPLPFGYKIRRGALLGFLLWLIGHFFGGL